MRGMKVALKDNNLVEGSTVEFWRTGKGEVAMAVLSRPDQVGAAAHWGWRGHSVHVGGQCIHMCAAGWERAA